LSPPPFLRRKKEEEGEEEEREGEKGEISPSFNHFWIRHWLEFLSAGCVTVLIHNNTDI